MIRSTINGPRPTPEIEHAPAYESVKQTQKIRRFATVISGYSELLSSNLWQMERYLVVVLALLMGCSDASGEMSPATRVASITSLPADATTAQTALAGFCDLAVRATEGNVSMDVPLANNELVAFPGLSDGQRDLVRRAVSDAIPQVRSGNGYDTTRLVAAINEICGLQLAATTMTP